MTGVKVDYTGQKFGHWTILEELGGGKVLCQCDCETQTIKELYKKAVIGGKSKSCGCAKVKKSCGCAKKEPTSKYIGAVVKGWEVISKVQGEPKVLCRDKDGNEKIFYTSHVARGGIASPDYNRLNSLAGQKINHWTVIEELGSCFKGGGKIKCQCDCLNKTVRILYKTTVTRGLSKSCGCASKEITRQTMLEKYGDVCTLKIDKPREQWQIDIINNKDKFEEYLKAFEKKPNALQLSELLGVNKSVILKTIKQFDLGAYFQYMYGESYGEQEIISYIKSITNCEINTHCRNILPNNYELDIHIPDLSIAIEFNGNYWHSEYFKDKQYHQLKTLACMNKGIRLMHIFEHEWINNKEKMKRYLKSVIGTAENKIYARDCKVEEIDNNKAIEFLDKYHLQGGINSSINLGLTYNNELIGIMTFGSPRFSKEFDYEMYRLCYKYNYIVVGGTEKLFKYFLDNYNVNSIVSFCSLSKFNGDVYNRLGFELQDITKPNYIWCNSHYKILTRYQTQKHKLIEMNLGKEEQTEDEIMLGLGYFKVYDSGNAKYTFIK